METYVFGTGQFVRQPYVKKRKDPTATGAKISDQLNTYKCAAACCCCLRRQELSTYIYTDHDHLAFARVCNVPRGPECVCVGQHILCLTVFCAMLPRWNKGKPG